MFSW